MRYLMATGEPSRRISRRIYSDTRNTCSMSFRNTRLCPRVVLTSVSIWTSGIKIANHGKIFGNKNGVSDNLASQKQKGDTPQHPANAPQSHDDSYQRGSPVDDITKVIQHESLKQSMHPMLDRVNSMEAGSLILMTLY